MNRTGTVVFLLLVIITQFAYGQKSLTVKLEAKLRKSDNPLSEVISTIPSGTSVKEISKTGSYYKVEYKGLIGYLSEIFVESSTRGSNSSLSGAVNSSEKNGYNRILKSEGKLKKEGSPMGDIIRIIPAGTTVKILSTADGYYKVRYRGMVGYISELYFSGSGISNNSSSSRSSYKKKAASKVWTEAELKTHWNSDGMDSFEGIYEATNTFSDFEVPCQDGYGRTICYVTWRRYDAKYRLAMLKTGNEYKLIYLSGKPKGSKKIAGCNCDGASFIPPNPSQWNEGDTKAIMYKTATSGLFKCNWYMGDKSLNEDSYITFQNYNYFTLLLSNTESTYLKLYPTSDNKGTQIRAKNVKSSGTGFALTSNGLIATNNHVIDGAYSIRVRGINGDFSKSYSAEVVVNDSNNDLAVLKINDYGFNNLGPVPYTIRRSSSDVGENIFVLGYPLRATMGDEVKLTDGIISSRTGFQGDVTSYQISAPIQPGNSGGPLFNSSGYLIGIINARHTGAENASYAIKSSYLFNLLDLLESPPSFPKVNSLNNKPLTKQVSLLKDFVYIIEVN